MQAIEQLYTPLRAAQQLDVPVEQIKCFMRSTRQNLRSRVNLQEVRHWLAEQAEERRQQVARWAAVEDWMERQMILEAHGLGEEHLPSIHRCAACGELRLDAVAAEALNITGKHACRSASPDETRTGAAATAL